MVRGMDQVEVGDSPIEVIRDTGNTSNYEAIAGRSGQCQYIVSWEYGRRSLPLPPVRTLPVSGQHFLSGPRLLHAGQTQLSLHTGQWGWELELVILCIIIYHLQIIKSKSLYPCTLLRS